MPPQQLANRALSNPALSLREVAVDGLPSQPAVETPRNGKVQAKGRSQDRGSRDQEQFGTLARRSSSNVPENTPMLHAVAAGQCLYFGATDRSE